MSPGPGWDLAIFAAGLAALPVVAEARRRDISRGAKGQDGDAGANSGGYAALSQGTTFYRWRGPPGGPVVVAVHGLTTPSQVYDAVAEGLARLGFRVLVYDLYGRGRSGVAQGLQDQAFFLRQLGDLLGDQGVKGRFVLIGYSMGGAIATAFAAANPDRVTHLVLLAPAGVEIVEDRIGRFACAVPGAGDWLHAVLTPPRMRRALGPLRDAPTQVPGIVAVQLGELRRKGFLAAVLSSWRGMLSGPQEDAHRRIAQADVPVLAIWAQDDDVIPLRAAKLLAQWNPQARQVVVQDAGHGLPHTHADEVVALLRSDPGLA